MPFFYCKRLHVYLHRCRAITDLYRHVNRRFKSSRMVDDLISLHKGSAKLSLLRERITRIVNIKWHSYLFNAIRRFMAPTNYTTCCVAPVLSIREADYLHNSNATYRHNVARICCVSANVREENDKRIGESHERNVRFHFRLA